MDYLLPRSCNGRSVIGSHTSWGEMRKLEHFLLLVKEIKEQGPKKFLLVMVGGTLNGYPLSAGVVQEVVEKFRLELSVGPDPDCDVRVAQEFFVPHFNVQLYHLNGRKRFCESSGSLHRGISIPVIFEANGMERLEGLKVVKVPSSEGLLKINFNRAVQEISNIFEQGIEASIDFNHEKAKKNSPKDFAKAIASNF